MGAAKPPRLRFSKLIQTKVTRAAYQRLLVRLRALAMTQSAYVRRLIQLDLDASGTGAEPSAKMGGIAPGRKRSK